MRDQLHQQYQVYLGKEIQENGLFGYEGNDGYYFLIPYEEGMDDEVFEQRSISEFIRNQGTPQIGLPLFTTEGKLYTNVDGQNYMFVQVPWGATSDSNGRWLTTLHEAGNQYPYQPQHISRYGQWKSLWEDKVDAWFEQYKVQWNERPCSSMRRLFIETFPYVEGLSECAIQYLQESEQDWRYESNDQGTFTFQRLHPSMMSQTIWPHTLVYDHPARDLAEWIRYSLLENGNQAYPPIRSMLDEYESTRPLSVFSWRLIYARLIYPVHLFDVLERTLSAGEREQNDLEQEYRGLLQKQDQYEKQLKEFFNGVHIDYKRLRIPILDW
ncbi:MULTISPECIES: spore coat putative kinase YutH [Pontibacillus]|uniref:Spore coat protein YutH n=1 Tax=Pontibacillus chungwhensis TaxID=265426 RepID=A0ABY8V0K6_9BACI|nr:MULTISPECIES: spore coat protein YutH [Pontibacillus]MCD5325158.1 spore coat protein YutH [Pontibacillus sp. HN14]WIF97406.1 spore coat protein YutH [Pontibacillus chungwhensis]